jgi:hypothetical protein
MAQGPQDKQCYKKKKKKKKNLKIVFFFFFSSKNFHILRALSHSFGTETMAQDPQDKQCYKKKKKKKNYFFCSQKFSYLVGPQP